MSDPNNLLMLGALSRGQTDMGGYDQSQLPYDRNLLMERLLMPEGSGESKVASYYEPSSYNEWGYDGSDYSSIKDGVGKNAEFHRIAKRLGDLGIAGSTIGSVISGMLGGVNMLSAGKMEGVVPPLFQAFRGEFPTAYRVGAYGPGVAMSRVSGRVGGSMLASAAANDPAIERNVRDLVDFLDKKTMVERGRQAIARGDFWGKKEP